ncbi:hypothetical protein Tco_0145265 [Tanacetum coccineum]
MEIGLSTKRMLGFVRGSVIRMNDMVQDANVDVQEVCASLSNKFGEFYFIVKFGISGLLHQVVTALADRIQDKARIFLNALSSHKEELRLFQFWNGLDEYSSSQRSQILLMNPLPTVESACSLLQQEKSQREVV